MNTNPSRGPYHFRAPSKIFWRTVRGSDRIITLPYVVAFAWWQNACMCVKFLIMYGIMLKISLLSESFRSPVTRNLPSFVIHECQLTCHNLINRYFDSALTLSVPHFLTVAKWIYQIVQDHTGLTHHFLNFWHSGSLALSPERQRARMSKIKKMVG